jgi:hypothetical protein
VKASLSAAKSPAVVAAQGGDDGVLRGNSGYRT